MGLWWLGNYCFVLFNPKDDDGKTKSLLQVIPFLYVCMIYLCLFTSCYLVVLLMCYIPNEVCVFLFCCLFCLWFNQFDSCGQIGHTNAYIELLPCIVLTRLLSMLWQDVLNIYSKELPDMNYAANTGKESQFLERCLLNGYKHVVYMLLTHSFSTILHCCYHFCNKKYYSLLDFTKFSDGWESAFWMLIAFAGSIAR